MRKLVNRFQKISVFKVSVNYDSDDDSISQVNVNIEAVRSSGRQRSMPKYTHTIDSSPSIANEDPEIQVISAPNDAAPSSESAEIDKNNNQVEHLTSPDVENLDKENSSSHPKVWAKDIAESSMIQALCRSPCNYKEQVAVLLAEKTQLKKVNLKQSTEIQLLKTQLESMKIQLNQKSLVQESIVSGFTKTVKDVVKIQQRDHETVKSFDKITELCLSIKKKRKLD